MIWTLNRTLEDIEKQAITEALEHFNGNKTLAAEALGISIRTIRNKVHRYKLYQFRNVLRYGYIDTRAN